MAGSFKILLKLARRAGPAVFIVVMQYGPQLRKLMNDNPQFAQGITSRFQRVLGVGDSGTARQDLSARCQVLREQVTFLYASANTAEVAQQARQWRDELESIERALPVLDAMSRKQRSVQRRHLERRIDMLSQHILAASLVDDIENAEVAEEATKAEESTRTDETNHYDSPQNSDEPFPPEADQPETPGQ
ncbi:MULTISPECIES: hypothetical protein [unclassified Actinobaculum]|uniref:hypothetical protein n=1 Tax=unclassified Actinobaculum TaxID=2609299 RepID=UPI000D529A7B|nr:MULTISPECIES: hypothetical protein [unclassified Actinobaculum]AWE42414.1 hypothetical protein DDD63_06245 [Actinobaculum sp. 313]RTE48400.1 hypothetical protein EKN07_09940 [Actinobaculum sp. 352]